MKNAIRSFECVGCGIAVRKSCVKTVKYCSPECFRSHGRKGRRKTGASRPCAHCGCEIYVSPHRKATNRYCSRECANHGQTKKITIACVQCGISFTRSPSFRGQKFCSIKCRNDSPTFKQHTLKMGADQNRRKGPNKFEAMAYGVLHSMGIQFKAQVCINDKMTVDTLLEGKKVIIQFDGDYWHGNPVIYSKLDDRQRRRVTLDKSQDQYLSTCGYTVVRFWQSDFSNMEAVMKRLSEL